MTLAEYFVKFSFRYIRKYDYGNNYSGASRKKLNCVILHDWMQDQLKSKN